jgi:bifunctional oligoribonuclease and PAP phosphatase NrnA
VTAGAPESGDLEAEWARALKILSGAGEICLACHVRPDADALGSMLAVAAALHAAGTRGTVPGDTVPGDTGPGNTGPGDTGPGDTGPGNGRPAVRVVASFGDQPFAVPGILRFLPGVDVLSPPEDYPRRPSVMVTFDAASPDRLGLLESRAAAADELIVLDHHASNAGFGTVRLVDPAAPATVVLARELIGRLGIELTRDIALCLYAGLVTDTGSFKFSTTPRTHLLAAELLSTGIDPGAVARELFDRAPFGYLELLSAVLGRAELEPQAAGGLGLVWAAVTRADRAQAGLLLDAVEPVIDVLRRTDEAEVAVVLKESDNGDWLVSTRSKGRVNVGRACQALGGGGHAQAAGFTATGTAAAAMAALRERLGR